MSSMHSDPAMEAEHQALMDLVQDGEVTNRAVRDGAWSDPATWANGRVPGAGAVVEVPEGLHVTYDAATDASLFKLRVDGDLSFATDRDTRMKVDTFVVTDTGK